MPNIICSTVLKRCLPCDDDPIRNISAEDADTDRFLFNIDVVERPPLGYTFAALGCKDWCYSEESLFDAQLCAVQQATECVFETWRPPQDTTPPVPPPGPPTIFLNAQQECVVTCADGSTFGATIAAGRVSSMSQADANRIASSLACLRARQLRICIATTSITAACDDTAYSFTLSARGGTPWVITFDDLLFAPFCASLGDRFPYAWTIISGSLPTGLELNECSGVISGTPTTPGSYLFTVRATDSLGSFQTKQFTMVVAQITTASPLPDATAGTFYTQNLAVSPAHDQETEVWVLDFGSLPAGLTLSAAGVISGTPTGSGLSVFTVIVTFELDGGIAICEKDFTLTVEQCALPGSPVWSCPLNVTPKTYSPSDPAAPQCFVSSINRLYVDGSAGVVDVVDYTQAVPVLETTIALGGGAGSNRIHMIHEPVSDIVVGVYWANIATSQPTIFFIDPVLGTILSEITLSGFLAGFRANPLFINQTRDSHLVVLFLQSFTATSKSQLLLIDPVLQTVLLTRDIPFPIGGDNYIMTRMAFNCAMNEVVLAYDATGTSIETLQRIDLETLADVALITLPLAVTAVTAVDYDDATGHLICVEFEAGQFHIRIRDEVTGAQLQTIATGETTRIGSPRYNFALASFVAPCQALVVVKYYDTNVLSQTCSVSFAGLLTPFSCGVAENGNAYIGDIGGSDNVWQLLQT